MLWTLTCVVLLFLVVIGLVYRFSPLKKPELYELKGAHVLIPGGSSGIGKALARQAVEGGARVTILGRDKKKLEEAKVEILSTSPEKSKEVVYIRSVDLLGSYESVEKAIFETEAIMGPTDICVNCVGCAILARADESPIKDYQFMVDMNVLTAVKVTKAVAPGMKARRKGRIVFTSSLAGVIGIYGFAVYAAAKWGLCGLAEGLQMEMRPFNVFITLSLPPETDTPSHRDEKSRRPPECAIFSETSKVYDADVVAADILKDTLNGNFISVSGLDGYITYYGTCGMAPAHGVLDLLLQVCLMGVCRLILLAGRFWMDVVCQRHQSERDRKAAIEKRQ